MASLNRSFAVPSMVSRMSLSSNVVYTYEKKPDRWSLTGLDGGELNDVRFSTPVGPGTPGYDNFDASLALDPDGRAVWIGTLLGLTRVQVQS